MSIVLVTFPGAPKPCDEAKLKESDMESVLERRITGMLLQLPSFSTSSRFFKVHLIYIFIMYCRTCT